MHVCFERASKYNHRVEVMTRLTIVISCYYFLSWESNYLSRLIKVVILFLLRTKYFVKLSVDGIDYRGENLCFSVKHQCKVSINSLSQNLNSGH